MNGLRLPTHETSRAGSIADLPEPGPEALAHSALLVDLIRQRIADNRGSIGFDQYMDLALYAPGLGYYSAGAHKFGAAGDFVTAPEISPLFGQCLARQCAEILEYMPDGGIVEFGAGTGALAAAILKALQAANRLPASYCIVEVSAELRERQAATLREQVPDLLQHVEWLDDMPGAGFKGVILGNELLDALPVKCIAWTDDGLVERRVSCDEAGTLAWTECPAESSVANAAREIEEQIAAPPAPRYESEYNPGLYAWWKALAMRLRQAVVLMIDYGYPRREFYHSERHRGTLICHYRHRAHDNPFLYPGLQDISASVDFTAVASAAEAAGLDVLAYTTQAHFLLANGIETAVADVDDTRERLLLSQQIKRLVLPSEMGERFQVIGLGRGFDHPLRGFGGRDLRHRL